MAKKVREWTLHEEIGRGGMGVVYRATHSMMPDKQFAVKVIKAELSEDAESRQRFLNEVMVSTGLHHPNVIEVRDPFEENSQLYLPMALLTGASVKQLTDGDDSPWPVPRAVEVIRQAAMGLGYAHRRDKPIVHRDVKPGNIQVQDDGTVKVLDFGLARNLGDKSMTATGHTVGTPAYMAPEVLEGRKATTRSDVYSLGVVLFRLLAGRLPIDMPEEESSLLALVMAVGRAHERGLPDVRQFNRAVPVKLAGIVASCLATAPEKRPADCAVMAEMLSGFAVDNDTTGLDIDLPFNWAEKVGANSAADAGGQANHVQSGSVRAAAVLAAAVQPRSVGGAAPSVASSDADSSELGVLTKFGTDRGQDRPAVARRQILPLAVGGSIVAVLVVVLVFVLTGSGKSSQDAAPVAVVAQDAGQTAAAALADAKVAQAAADDALARSNAAAAQAAAADSERALLDQKGLVKVPAGKYKLGCNPADPSCAVDDQPAHEFTTGGYGIGRREVVLAEYLACMDAGGCRVAPGRGDGCNYGAAGRRGMYPVNCVALDAAAEYCKWRGMRLPSDAEWEAAARGPEGRNFPWGNAQPMCSSAALGCGAAGTVKAETVGGDKSFFGARDMLGNVREWTSSEFAPYAGSPNSGKPYEGGEYVTMGGSWLFEPSDALPLYARIPTPPNPVDAWNDIGFRCAFDLP